MEAWKCKYPSSFKQVVTDRPDQPTNLQTDRPGHRKVTLPFDNFFVFFSVFFSGEVYLICWFKAPNWRSGT